MTQAGVVLVASREDGPVATCLAAAGYEVRPGSPVALQSDCLGADAVVAEYGHVDVPSPQAPGRRDSDERDREALPSRRRARGVDPAQRVAGPRRARHAALLHHPGPRHHRAQGHRGEGALVRGAVPRTHGVGAGRHGDPVEISLSLPETDEGRLVSAAIRDITERKRAESIVLGALTRERELTETLRELDRIKSDFVATVSHELRTPLTSIVGTIEMLADGDYGELTPPQRRIVDVLDRNSHRLLDLIKDLLDLNHIESGGLPLKLRPTASGTCSSGSRARWCRWPRTRRSCCTSSRAVSWAT